MRTHSPSCVVFTLCCSVVPVLLCMFALRMAEDWQDPEGKPDIFDLNTYFHILMMSEGVLVTRDRATLSVCSKVLKTSTTKFDIKQYKERTECKIELCRSGQHSVLDDVFPPLMYSWNVTLWRHDAFGFVISFVICYYTVTIACLTTNWWRFNCVASCRILIAQYLILICFYPVTYCTLLYALKVKKQTACIEYSKLYRYGLIVRNLSELQKMWVAQGFI